MISREELLQSPEYWFEHIQNDLYGEVTDFMEKEGINKTELAERLGVTKGYVSQILKGEFNYTLKKLIELSLAVGKVPKIEYIPISRVIAEDNDERFVQLSFDRDLFRPITASHVATSFTKSINSSENLNQVNVASSVKAA